MMVKICGITNREDALAAMEAGASALGFVLFARSPRYVAPEQVARITSGLPASILKVGVFVDELPRQVPRILELAGLDLAQLHGSETLARVPKNVRVWKAFRVTPEWKPEAMKGFDVEAFLLDGAAPGQSFDWRLAAGLKQRIVLAGGLDESNVAEAIRTARPWGVDASSRLEAKPGVKDHEKIRRFVAAARGAAV